MRCTTVLTKRQWRWGEVGHRLAVLAGVGGHGYRCGEQWELGSMPTRGDRLGRGTAQPVLPAVAGSPAQQSLWREPPQRRTASSRRKALRRGGWAGESNAGRRWEAGARPAGGYGFAWRAGWAWMQRSWMLAAVRSEVLRVLVGLTQRREWEWVCLLPWLAWGWKGPGVDWPALGQQPGYWQIGRAWEQASGVAMLGLGWVWVQEQVCPAWEPRLPLRSLSPMRDAPLSNVSELEIVW